MGKNLAKDWATKVAQSGGNMVNVPTDMAKEAEEFQKQSQEFVEFCSEFDRRKADFELYAKNFWHHLRKSLETGGDKEIWSKNIGWNAEAVKDGIYVINVSRPSQGMPM